MSLKELLARLNRYWFQKMGYSKDNLQKVSRRDYRYIVRGLLLDHETLTTLRQLWHDSPAGFREGLKQYHPAEYAKWHAAMQEKP